VAQTQRPGYRQIADLIRAAIERGEYARGSRLPTETELAAAYGVTNPTINSAVGILRAEGLVRVERGRGTVVREIPEIHRVAAARYAKAARERDGARGPFDGEIRALGMEPRSETTVEVVTPPAAVAEALQLPPGQPNAIRRARRMFADNYPVQYAPSYIPLEIAQGTAIAEVDSGPGGIISRFAELGHAQVRVTEAVRSRRPTEEEQEFLRLDPDQFVTEIWHVGWTAEDRPVEVCVHAVPAYLWVLEYELPVT
jgi:GntR family transcriptional regulator